MPENVDIVPAPTAAPTAAAAPAHAGCSCGGHDEAEPVLDVRTIPHAIRHGVVLGAFESLPDGGALILVAPHEPRPLLAQLAARGPLQVTTLSAEPTEWRLRLTKAAVSA